MEGKDKIAQAHLDALPALLQPLIESSYDHKDITWQEADDILDEWDELRGNTVNNQTHGLNLSG